MLASLFDRGETDDWRIIVFGHQLRRRDEAWLRESCGGHGARLEFIRVDPDLPDLKRALSVKALSLAAYVRFLIPTLLADASDRLLYLDADTLVLSSLRPLADLDLGDHALAAVEDNVHPRQHGRLPFPSDKPYFNSGFLLIDLDRWRGQDLTQRAFDFAEEHAERLQFPDQDALNCVLAGRWMQLGREWNFHYDKEKDSPHFARPRVMHFAGLKPVYAECSHPARDLFLHYRAMTPWRDQRLKTRFERRMGKIINKRMARVEQRLLERARSTRLRVAQP